jgi:homocysteine S-methyltransferase
MVCNLSNLVNRHAKSYLLLDGGFSTCLECHIPLHRELWSGLAVKESYGAVVNTHRSFLDAGSDIITTSSYQMSHEGFKRVNIPHEEANALLKKSISAAREAISISSSSSSFVAASIGSYGAYLANGAEYTGHYGDYSSALKLETWHEERLTTLLSAEPDIIACETIPRVSEVVAFRRLLSKYLSSSSSSSAAWISLAIRDKDGDSGSRSDYFRSLSLNSGESIEDAVRALEDPSTDETDSVVKNIGLGVNCCSPDIVCSALESFQDTASKNRIFICYPNSGEVWDGVRKEWSKDGVGKDKNEDADAILSHFAPMYYDAGATIIGGCCRTTPSTICSIRTSLDIHTGLGC